MINRQFLSSPRTLRFRRWSRKAYAAFASIGVCVSIGQVGKSITERALTKQSEVTLSITAENAGTNREAIRAKADTTTIEEIELLLAQIQPQIERTLTEPYDSPSLYNSINRGRDVLNASCNFAPSIRRDSGSCKMHSVRLHPLFTHTL